ncbi:MAG: FAD-binding oxidoreductase [Promethearchaeota archaeon]
MRDQDYEVITQKLRGTLGEDRVFTQTFHRMAYSRDWSPRDAKEAYLPDIVVRPFSIEEASKMVKIANEYKIPVIPYAGGTGMSGASVPIYGGISVDMKGLDKVKEVDVKNMTVTCGVGITILRLNEILAEYGLWFPHDPESKPASTVGSAIACNNDGTFAIKYGRTPDFLLNMIVVTGTGQVLRIGHRKALMSSTGLNLMPLFIGSEGTLGLVCEAILRIYPLPKARAVLGLLFRSITDAINSLQRLLQAGLSVESAHINCGRRLNFYSHSFRLKHNRDPNIPEWANAVLFISFNGDEAVVNFSKDYTLKILEELGGEPLKEEDMIDSWWNSKHTGSFIPFRQKWPDSQREKKFGAADLGLPIGRVEEGYKKYLEIAEKNGLEILGMCVYNEKASCISPSISFAVWVDDKDPESVLGWWNYVKEMSYMAVDLEGTMSTYWGDGQFRVEYNRYEHGDSLDVMMQIKKIFDPNNIMNPGKKFDMKELEKIDLRIEKKSEG